MNKRHTAEIDYETCIAYYRNMLPQQQAIQVRAYLNAHPDIAEIAKTDAAYERAMAQPLDDILLESVPARLQINKRSAVRVWTGRVAFAAAIVASASVGWWVGQLPGVATNESAFTQRVVAAAQQPMAEDTTDAKASNVAELTAPNMSLQGYHLVRQRQSSQADNALTEFVYRSNHGKLMRIFAETNAGKHTKPIVSSHEGVSLAQWQDGDTRYAMVGETTDMALQTLAQAAQADTTGNGNQLADAKQLPAQSTSADKDGNNNMIVTPSTPLGDQLTPATANDDYTGQPAAM